MTTTEKITSLQKIRTKLFAKENSLGDLFLPDLDSTPLAQINAGTYDWTNLPRWVNSIPVTAHHLKQRRTIIERLCEDTAGKPDAAEIGINILECSKSIPCGSPFCPYCRLKEQEKRSAKALTKFAGTAKSEMTFLTILHPVTYDPMADARDHIDKLRSSVRNALIYRGLNQVQMLGAFEVDVKRRQEAQSKRSRRVLTALDMDTTSAKSAYLVHLHSLVDLGGHLKDDVRNAFTGVFNKPYQVRLSYLRKDMTKDESIDRIARYMFKFRVQFADNLFANEVGLRARYNQLYTGELMREYVPLIHSLKINNAFKGLHFKYN